MEEWRRAGYPLAKPKRKTGGARSLRASTIVTYESALKRHILPKLGDRKLASLKRKDIERFQDAIVAGETATDQRTGPRGRARVTGGAGIAGQDGRLPRGNPLLRRQERAPGRQSGTRVDVIPSEHRERFLSAEEFQALGAALAAAEAGGEPALHGRHPAARPHRLSGSRRSAGCSGRRSICKPVGFISRIRKPVRA